MTATEQLAIWAAGPTDEIFFWLQYPQDDEVFVSSSDMPNTVGRMRASDVLAGIQRKADAANGIARGVLARFQKSAEPANTLRLDEINGIACVLVEGNSPVFPHSPYRLLLSSVAPFI